MKNFIIDALMITAVICVLVLLLFCPAKAYAQTIDDPYKWTTTNTVMELSFYAVCFIDYRQTRFMSQHNWHQVCSHKISVQNGQTFESVRYYEEANPILGNHPTSKQLLLFGFSSCIIQTSVSYILCHPYREIFQGLSVGIETGNVIRNKTNGIPFSCVWNKQF